MSITPRFCRSFFLAALALALPIAAQAIDHDVEILLDLDNDSSTGCTVTTVDGPFDGAEQILLTSVETTSPPPAGTVVDVALQNCVDPLTDTFSAPASFDSSGWPIGVDNGIAGLDVVETYLETAALSLPGVDVVRLGVVVTDELGNEEALLTVDDTTGGAPILINIQLISDIPTLGELGLLALCLLVSGVAVTLLGRRGAVAVLLVVLVVAASGVAFAAVLLDGQVTDWLPGDQVASDGMVLFAKREGTQLCFRVDVELQFNTAPTADPQSVSTPEETPLAITLTGSDPESDPLTFTIVPASGPTNGLLTGTPPNVTYSPNLNYVGPDSFDFQVEDPSGATDTATVSITVTEVNDPPVVDAATFTVAENQPVTTPVGTVTFTDPDAGQTHTFAITAGNTGGAFAIDANTGVISIAAVLDFETLATYSLTVEVTDNGVGTLSDTETITINVTDADDAPVGVDDTATVTEDDPAAAIDVLTNDTDTDGGPKLIASASDPANGTVVLTGGSPGAHTGLTYQPDPDYCNSPPGTTLDTFTYTLNPGGDTATVSVTVTCVDDDPVAVDDSATVGEDSGANTIDVQANDTDVDSGPISITAVQNPSAQGGTVLITGGGADLSYEPAPDYCNSPPGTTLDTFTYTLSPGSDTATVTVTVTCADDDPVAVDDSATVGEDSGANAVDVLANDTDVDAGPKSVDTVQNPSAFGGTVLVTGGGTGVSYAPAPNYCNDPPATTLDTFTYTLDPGGDSATVTVTVSCADDAPVAVPDAATVVEDSAGNPIDVLANDTDLDLGPKTVNTVQSPSTFGGTVLITGGGTGVSYSPSAHYCNTPPGTTLDTFDYSLNGGSTTTVTVSVTCVNDGPVVDLDADDDQGTGGADFAVTFTEGDGPTLLEDPDNPQGATITDVDGATLMSLVVTLTNLLDSGDETLDANAAPFPNITKVYDTTTPGVGVLTLSSITGQPIADYVAVLRTVSYDNTDNAPDATARVVSFVANDGAANGNTAVSTVTVVPVDSDPVAVDDSATVAEDSGATAIDVLTNDTDADGGPKLIASATQPANGTVVLTGGSPGAHTGLTYQPDAEYCNDGSPFDTFTYTLTPGGDTATVSVTVTCTDDNPVAVNDSATVAEDSGATAIDVLTNDTDVDAGPKTISIASDPANGTVVLTGGSPGAHTGLTYQPDPNYCNGGSPVDTFTYTLNGGSIATVSVTVTCVDDNPVAVNDAATVTEDDPATAIDVLTNDTDVDAGPKVIASATQPVNGTVVLTGGTPGAHTGLTYQPDPNYCNGGSPFDTFTYTLNGGSVATVSVTVTCVDDPPVAVNDAATVNEDAAATAIDVLANDTDIDAGPKTISSAGDPANGTVVLTGGSPGAHTGLTYAPDANYCNSAAGPSGTPDTFTYTLNGGSIATVSVTVICINDPPTLTDASLDYSVAGNTQLRVGETTPGNSVVHIRDNDDVDEKAGPITDIDGPGPIAVVPQSITTVGGGNFVLNADGTFTYESAAGFTGNDVIPFQVTDSGAPAGIANGTITIAVSQTIWYVTDVVDADNPAGGDTGRSTNAFEVLGDVEAVVTDNDFIFVFDGTNPYDGGVDLDNTGVKLHGEGIGLIVPGFGTLVPAGGVPQITNAGAAAGPEDNGVNVIATAATLAGVEIRGLDITGRDNGIDVTASGANSVTVLISNNMVSSDATNGIEGIDINANGTGASTTTVTLSNNALGGRGNAIDARTTAAGGLLRVALNSNANVVSNGNAIVVDGSAGGNATITGFSNNSVHGDTLGAGLVVNAATFDQTPGGAVQQVDGDNLSIGASGNPVGNAGVALTTVQGNLFFDDLDVFAAVGTGLQVSGTGGGMTFAVTPAAPAGSGTSVIDADNGAAVDISSTALDLRLSDLDSDTSGSGVSLSTVSGQFGAPSGSQITKASGGGTALSVSSSSATVVYGGTLNVTSGAGVSLTSNTGSTAFSGTLTLTTVSNVAFNATGGGSVTATDTASTLSTTTATALNVNGTTIGAADLRFRSISSGVAGGSGPTNGINLNNTGALGGLIVSGNGGTCTFATPTCTGGTIQSSTGDAVRLVSTQDVSLTRMRIHDNDTNGIYGDELTNLTVADSVVSDNDFANPSAFEAGIKFNELFGTNSITNTVVRGTKGDNIRLEMAGTGTLNNLTLSGVTVGPTANVGGGFSNGLSIVTSGTPTVNVTVTNSLFTGVDATKQQSSGILTSIGGGTTTLTVTGSDFVQENIGIDLGGSAGTHRFNIDDNDLTFHRTNAINIVGNGVLDGTINNNRVGNGTLDSGSMNSFGIAASHRGNSNWRLAITNNTVRNSDFEGIFVRTGDLLAADSGRVDLTLRDNTVFTPDDNSGFPANPKGMHLRSRQSTTLCMNIVDNEAQGAGAAGYHLQESDTSLLQFQGFNTNAVTTLTANGNTTGGGAPTTNEVGAPFAGNCAAALPNFP